MYDLSSTKYESSKNSGNSESVSGNWTITLLRESSTGFQDQLFNNSAISGSIIGVELPRGLEPGERAIHIIRPQTGAHWVGRTLQEVRWQALPSNLPKADSIIFHYYKPDGTSQTIYLE